MSKPTPDLPAPPNRGLVQAFLWTAMALLALFILAQTWGAIAKTGPAARVRALMPTIGAQSMDIPLTDDQANYPLEATPGAPPVTLASLPAEPIIFLNFWASWCEPCVRELPSMVQLRREMAGRPFMMVAVSYDEDPSVVDQFFRRQMGGTPRELTLWRDPGGESDPGLLRRRFGTEKLPETYIIRNGRILARFVNARDWADPDMVSYFKALSEAPSL